MFLTHLNVLAIFNFFSCIFTVCVSVLPGCTFVYHVDVPMEATKEHWIPWD